jgi:uncharacterized membrane protein YczE
MTQENRTAIIASKVLAASILISTLRCWRLGLLPWSLFVDPWTKLQLLTVGLNFPIFALCLSGSIALLLGKRWGYYCIYASLPFSLFGACICFIPFITQLLPSSTMPYVTMWIMLGINLLVTGVLVWTDWVTRKEIVSA